jgi:hypothetical protein
MVETIESETRAKLTYDAETELVDVEGTTEEQIARAENLLRENKVEAMKQLRSSSGS